MCLGLQLSDLSNAQDTPKMTPLYYLDLNAISPRSAREINDLFTTTAPLIRLVDGGIIGAPPSLKATQDDKAFKTNVTVPPPSSHAWSRPSIPISGPHKFTSPDAPSSGANLAEVLSLKDIGDDIGKASGLKCCFASTTKGFTALCIQAFTTAQSLGVLDELKLEMGDRIPGMLKTATGGLTASKFIDFLTSDIDLVLGMGALIFIEWVRRVIFCSSTRRLSTASIFTLLRPLPRLAHSLFVFMPPLSHRNCAS